MTKLGLPRHRRAVAILCCLQIIVSIMLVKPAMQITAYRLGDLHILGWILQVSFGLSGLFGLLGLCLENSIVMIISKFLLIIVIVLLMILTLMMVSATIIFADKKPAMLMCIAWTVSIVISIIAHIYATVSACALAKAYRQGPIQPVAVTAI